MPELRCPRIRYLSPGDEAAFFHWASSIPGVFEVVGRGTEIVLLVRSTRLSASSLRELVALFHRYHAPMRQLSAFHSPQNTSWFASPAAYWHKAVFPNGA